MTDEDVRAIARAAVMETLLTLGVDAKDPEAILTMQKDFAYLREWRKSIETVKQQSLKAAIGVIVTGVLGLVLTVLFKGQMP